MKKSRKSLSVLMIALHILFISVGFYCFAENTQSQCCCSHPVKSNSPFSLKIVLKPSVCSLVENQNIKDEILPVSSTHHKILGIFHFYFFKTEKEISFVRFADDFILPDLFDLSSSGRSPPIYL